MFFMKEKKLENNPRYAIEKERLVKLKQKEKIRDACRFHFNFRVYVLFCYVFT